MYPRDVTVCLATPKWVHCRELDTPEAVKVSLMGVTWVRPNLIPNCLPNISLFSQIYLHFHKNFLTSGASFTKPP